MSTEKKQNSTQMEELSAEKMGTDDGWEYTACAREIVSRLGALMLASGCGYVHALGKALLWPLVGAGSKRNTGMGAVREIFGKLFGSPVFAYLPVQAGAPVGLL